MKIETGSDNQILRTKSQPIKKVDKKLGKFFDEMQETMHKANGIGLAGPQAGVNDRIAVCYFNHGTDHELIVDMINPEIISHSDKMITEEEGCLSIPGKFDKVARYDSVTVKYLDRKGKEQILKLTGLNARIVQHEVDHLDGKLYIDRVTEQRPPGTA